MELEEKVRLDIGVSDHFVEPTINAIVSAARTGEVQLVPDVEAFPGHIACSSSTRSELVLPVRDASGTIIAVFDIDSDLPDAFSEADAVALSTILSEVFEKEGIR